MTENSQVIITRNIDISKGLVNGTRGVIRNLNNDYVVIQDIYNNTHTINYFKDALNKKNSFRLVIFYYDYFFKNIHN